MELKKNENKNVSRYSTLFRNFGFVISLCLVIMAFEWKWKTIRIIIPDHELVEESSLISIEITHQDPEQPKPPKFPKTPPKVILSAEMTKTPNSEPIDVPTPPAPIPPDDGLTNLISSTVTTEESPDVIVEGRVEKLAVPLIGQEEWYKKIGAYLNKQMQRQGLSTTGRKWVSFVVEKDGTISDVQVLVGSGNKRIDAIMLAAVRSGGNWEPAKQNLRSVRFRMKIPILFQ